MSVSNSDGAPRVVENSLSRLRSSSTLLGSCLIAALLLNLLVPIFIGPGLPYFDEAVYGARTLGIRDAVLDTDWKAFIALLTTPRLHPPLVELSAVPLSLVLDNAPLALRLTHWLWVVLLCIALVLLAKSLGLSTLPIITALIFLLTTPVLLSEAWNFGTDIPLAAMVLFSLWLLSTRPFSRLERAAVLGIAVGSGLLVKESYPLFVAGPIVLEVARELRSEGSGESRLALAVRALAAALVAAAIAAVWYWPNLRWLAQWVPGAYRSPGSARIFGTSNVLSLGEVLDWLARAFLTEGLVPWVTLMGIYGALALYQSRRQLSSKWTVPFVASSAIPALVVWTTSTSKAVRYILPVLIIVIVLSAQGSWRAWQRGILGRLLVSGALAGSLVVALTAYWVAPRQFPLFARAAEASATIGLRIVGPFSSQAMAGDWHSVDVLSAVADDARRRGMGSAHVVVLSRYPAVSDNAYRFVVAWKRFPLDVGATSLQGWLPLLKQARDADYVVAKVGGDQGELDGVVNFSRLWAFLAEGFSHSELARYALPDGSYVVAYRRHARWYLGETGNAVYRLYEALGDAEIRQIPKGNTPEQVVRTLAAVRLGGKEMPALFQHPPGKLVFPLTLPRRKGIEFRTAVGLVPEALGRSDGVVFRVLLLVDGGTKVLLDVPYGPSSGGQWLDYRIDLSEFAGRHVNLELQTDVGPSGDPAYDWAVWGEPAIYTTEE